MDDNTAGGAPEGVGLGGPTGTGEGGVPGNGGGPSGGNAGGAPTGSGPTDGGSAAWYSTVEDNGLRTLAEQKGWKSPADALKSYKELETAYSSRGAAPKAPSNASEYKFNVPTDLPEGTYNEGFAGWFREAAHKAGVPQEMAAGLHDAFVEYAKGTIGESSKAQQAAFNESVTATKRDLETAWGQMGTPGFERNIEMAKRAIRLSDPGLMDALKQAGVIAEVGGQPVVTNAAIVKALAKMGEGMYAEDSLYGDPASSKNPFAEGTEDLMLQGRLVREDPDKAAQLIRAANRTEMFKQFLERHAKTKK